MLDMNLGGASPLEVVERLDTVTEGGGIATYRFELDGKAPESTTSGADPDLFRWRGRELGIDFDVYGSAQRAYDVGRVGPVDQRLTDRLRARFGNSLDLEPKRVYPDVSYRPEAAGAAVGKMTTALERAPEDAALQIEGGDNPQPVVIPSKQGLTISKDATLDNLDDTLRELETTVALVSRKPYPRILTPAAEKAAEKANKVLKGGPVVIEDAGAREFDAPASYEILASDLPSLVLVDPAPGAGEIDVSLDAADIAAKVRPIANSASRSPQNASLYFDSASENVEVEPSEPGRAAQPGRLETAMRDNLLSGQKSFDLKVEKVEPSQTTAEAEALRPEDLLGGYTTTYRPADSNDVRNGNIAAVANAVHGTLVPPGGSFSMLDAVESSGLSVADFTTGPEGYVTDPGKPERPPVGDAAGLSQVSSTLYAAALLANLNVTERSPVPEGSPPLPYTRGGLEAYVGPGTSADPAGPQDLVFENNTDAYLLLRANTDGSGEIEVAIEGRTDEMPEDVGGPAANSPVRSSTPSRLRVPELRRHGHPP